jgi:hypothetical protein
MSITSTAYFTPKSITGCRLWLDAADSSTITVSGSNVTNVADKSGNGTVLSNATGFTYPNNSFNGSYPSFLCSSGGIYQANNAARLGYNSAFAQTTPFTVFFVSHQTQTSPGYIMDSQSGSGRQYTYALDFSTPFGNSGIDSASVPSVVSQTWISGTSVLYINGTSSYSGSLGSFTTGGIIVGNRFSIDESWPGHICELIYFSGQLGTTQRQQVESYLAQKWGLSSSLPAGHPGINSIVFRSSILASVRVTPYSFPASTIVYTGSFIPYTVPNNCTSLTFNMWGAGGPGAGLPGGGGAYNTGKIAVTSGEVLQLIVGRGGQYGTATQWSTMTNAEGGGGGGGGLSGQGGQGGGRTAIQKLVSGSYLEVVTAGGGGSAGGNAGTYGGNAHFSGTSQSAGTTYGQGRVPTGGSATAGGLNTFTARVGFPWDGTQFTGGFASNAFNVSPVTGACGGGGGGGGYYGGGGGGRSGADTYGGGGGGSYSNVTYITNYSGSNGTSNVAVASGIAGYITGCGRGGSSGSTNNGSNGLIVLTPVAPNPVASFLTNYPLTAQTFQYTGANQTFTVPSGITLLTVSLWGAGGGYNGYYGAGAGAGSYLNGTLTVTAGQVLSFVVGPGGQKFVTYAGSGIGNSVGYPQINVGYGGGRSSVQRLLTSSITAGSSTSSNLTYTTSVTHGLMVDQPVTVTGMGTAAYNIIRVVATIPTSNTFTVLSTSAPSAVTGQSGTLAAELVIAGGGGGGAGGNPGGRAAFSGNATAGSGSSGGGGGTTTAGGTATANSTAGSLLTGGNGGSGGYSGGGGGGFYGGGGGGSSSGEGGGGGGSSWYSSLFTFISGANGTSGAPGASPGTGDAYFASAAGAPQEAGNTNLGNGLIAITYRARPAL